MAFNYNDIVLTAKLLTGKRVVVEPNYAQRKCQYRYMTEIESCNEQINTKDKYVWFESALDTTVEEGVTLIFTSIEGTPIVVNRF